jgi:hypothetical protein
MGSLSEAAAGWVDRIYRRIVRDGRYCQIQPVGDPGALSPASSCASPCEPGLPSAALPENVLVDDIEHEHSAMLGPLLPVKAAWENLGISPCLRELGFGKRQILAACASVISRLVEPSSEHSLVRWIPTTALPELESQTPSRIADT